MRLKLLLAAVTLSASLHAFADTFTFNFSGPGTDSSRPPNPVTVSGSGSVVATLTAPGMYEIDSISGTTDGATITGLDTGPGYPYFLQENAVTGLYYTPFLLYQLAGRPGDVGIYTYSTFATVLDYASDRYATLPVNFVATPEPSSLALLGTGLLGLVGFARKRFA